MTPGDDPLITLLDESAEDLYEHAPCGYLSLLEDSTIAKVNATLLAWTGYERPDLVGRRFRDLLSVGGRIYFETHVSPLLRMQESVREIAFEMVRRGGERFPVLVNAQLRQHAAGGAVTRMTVFDATDRRRYERELLAARQRAEEAARAKQTLIATISHDVRAPLGAIATAAALLDQASPTPAQAQYIRILRSSAARAIELVDNALDLSRLEAGRAQLRERPFALRQLVDELAAEARAAAVHKPALEIRTQVDEAVPDALLGDRAKIAQVVTNLLMNGVKFTARGFVSLTVGARATTGDDVILEVVVADSGIGIAADRIPHIFEEYAQANDEIGEHYGGSGLGLAIVRRLLHLHGSALRVDSTVGQGTTCSFDIVLKRDAPPR
jgi:PAS domain S-box-containing protein